MCRMAVSPVKKNKAETGEEARVEEGVVGGAGREEAESHGSSGMTRPFLTCDGFSP